MPIRAISHQPLNVGLVIPQSGPSGLFGPSCQASAELSIAEINYGGGILGREVVATVIDGGAQPQLTARRVANLIDRGQVDCLVGWHTSAVRRELVRTVRGRIPYMYTAVYEGGEDADGVFMTGERPDGLIAAMSWMADERAVRSWFVVGSDYVWPHGTVDRIRRQATGAALRPDMRIAGSIFAPLGTDDFSAMIDVIERSEVDGILVLLLGQDAVAFNRAFAERGLHRDIVRLGPLIDENMLLAGGFGANEELYSVSGYFESLATGASLDFSGRYSRRFGPAAPPLTAPGESCYDGVALLAKLVGRAATTDVRDVDYHAQSSFDYDDSPRGHVRLQSRHLAQDIYLARADGVEFDVLAQVRST